MTHFTYLLHELCNGKSRYMEYAEINIMRQTNVCNHHKSMAIDNSLPALGFN